MLSLTIPNVQRSLRLFLLLGICYAAADLSAKGCEQGLVLPDTPARRPPARQAAAGLASRESLLSVLSTTAPAVPAGGASGPAAQGTAPGASAPTVPAGPPPRLSGTLAGSGCRLAVLMFGEETRVLAPGEAGNGYTVLDVDHYSVRLRDPAGQTQTLTFGEGALAVAPAATPSPAAAAAAAPAPVAVAKGLPTRRELNAILDNPGDIMTRTRFLPVRNGEEVLGMQLNFTGDDHPFARLGLQTGDVANSLNGHPLKGAQDVSDLISEFRNAQTLHFELTRGGKPQKLDVTLPE